MKLSKLTDRFATAIMIVAIFVIIFLAGGAMALYWRTIVAWWLPVTVAVAFTATIAAIYRLRDNFCSSFTWLDKTIFAIGGGVLATFLLLGANYLFADSESTHVEQATITNVFSKDHQRYRRVGAGRHSRMVATGETYKSYHISFRLSNGREKERQVAAGSYRRYHIGDPYEITLQRGLLGFPVIKPAAD